MKERNIDDLNKEELVELLRGLANALEVGEEQKEVGQKLQELDEDSWWELEGKIDTLHLGS